MFGSSAGSGDDTAEPFAHAASSPAFATASSSKATSHLVPLFPSASDAALEGFVRVINHSGDTGEVQIDGTIIYPKNVHKALRRYLGIENSAGAQRLPFHNTEDFTFFG